MADTGRHGPQDWQALYRDATLRHAALAGITRPSFLCRKCRKNQAVSGRRQVVPGTSRFGYYCACCAAAGAQGGRHADDQPSASAAGTASAR